MRRCSWKHTNNFGQNASSGFSVLRPVATVFEVAAANQLLRNVRVESKRFLQTVFSLYNSLFACADIVPTCSLASCTLQDFEVVRRLRKEEQAGGGQILVLDQAALCAPRRYVGVEHMSSSSSTHD